MDLQLQEKDRLDVEAGESGYISYHLSAGYSWDMGSKKTIRLEGRIVSSGGQWVPSWHPFQVAVNIGRWFN